jgi:hypothetical protein
MSDWFAGFSGPRLAMRFLKFSEANSMASRWPDRGFYSLLSAVADIVRRMFDMSILFDSSVWRLQSALLPQSRTIHHI